MEARLFRCARLLVCLATVGASLWIAPQAHSQILRSRIGAIRAHQAHTKNFIVFASSPEWAQQVAQAAETYRRDLAMHWLGEELPQWAERCPIHVSAGPNLNASGETKFSPTQFGVGNWMMTVNGTPERVLDSVLPHEISHTIFATHFASYAHQTDSCLGGLTRALVQRLNMSQKSASIVTICDSSCRRDVDSRSIRCLHSKNIPATSYRCTHRGIQLFNF